MGCRVKGKCFGGCTPLSILAGKKMVIKGP